MSMRTGNRQLYVEVVLPTLTQLSPAAVSMGPMSCACACGGGTT